METTNVLKDITESNNVVKASDIDVDEDSGFSSRPDTNDEDDSNDNLICNDVKFSTIKIEEPRVKKTRPETEEKRAREEDYQRQRKEQAYNSLKHLLKKSKFYSNFIKANVNNPKKSPVKRGRSPTRNSFKKRKKSDFSDDDVENSPPKKTRFSQRTLLKKIEKINNKTKGPKNKKLNLSLSDIEDELNAKSDDEEKNEEEKKFEAPIYFTGQLHPYQTVGLDWLRALHKNGLNGILADEMGLGKTIQVIALICWLIEIRVPGPYLIIAPLSTIPNWEAEFKRFAPELPVYVLHGTLEARKAVAKKIKTKKTIHGFKTHPIVLTTYDVALRDANTVLRDYNWRYMVVDEGQRIKNHNSQLACALRTVNSVHRLILTGTPLQNDLNELWALLNFLQPDIFNDLDVFQSWFDIKEMLDEAGAEKILEQEKQKNIVSMLREILKPFMLRRVKEEVGLNLPNKKEMIVYAPITEIQRELYTAVLNYDCHVLSMKPREPAIIESPADGRRPKRACSMRNKYSENYFNPLDLKDMDGDINALKSEKKPDILDDKHLTEGQRKILSTWINYTDIDERNKDYFIRLNFSGNRYPLYRKIVDHPYLVHWPKSATGYLQIDENLIKSSGKLLVLDAMLHKLHAKGHKVLIFSTLVMLLDLLEEYLTLREWNYVTLSGRTKIEERDENIYKFNNDPDVFLFLLSTRAGGLGLNLAAADTVIIYDSDWNPQVDIQAMARCHRIGQTRPVVIYKLCTKGTIDETVMNRALAKRNLEKMVISKELEPSINITANFVEELRRLFNSSNDIVITSKKQVYSDAELEKILDRSDLFKVNSENSLKN
ncbi:GSCOCG00004151001-RA-CDS [Cotesia congregata]|nr:GSCOCG00004151001-RA-CDS [Cotesia congregata]